ncbi:hypothetical protein Nans01_14150 [Nocardiopsis ansamitocini]|uniref:Uncharacterized protein n=1 Tax=Nocardiopsis ansamitocini TaxID=1670832 RepID=A0A9W6P4S4_9ACTN|nr:hypothetical protein Nans01_14150 [Nocardiopsis ansamitocini]
MPLRRRLADGGKDTAATRAVALKAVPPDEGAALTRAERTLPDEWLDRLTRTGNRGGATVRAVVNGLGGRTPPVWEPAFAGAGEEVFRPVLRAPTGTRAGVSRSWCRSCPSMNRSGC